MSSTNRTPNLGLNSWLETDKPKRVDFVSDNNIIDSVISTHLSDTVAHMTQSEKDKAVSPYEVVVAYGTGESSLNINFDFEPSFVIAFKKNAPIFEYSNSKNIVNCAIATKRGASSGISLTADLVALYRGTVPDTSYFNSMNEQYEQYVVIAFK